MIKINYFLRDHDHIIWDWNGTLLNDVEIALKSINEVLRLNHLKEITLDNYRKSFGFPIKKFYENIGFNFASHNSSHNSSLKLSHDWDKVAEQFIDAYKTNFVEASLFSGARELLAELKKQKKRLSILSASKEASLLEHVAAHQLTDYFDTVYGLGDHYAFSKVDRGRQLLQESQISPSRTLLVGDTDHDVQVAKELSIDVLILSGGHQSFDRFTPPNLVHR